MTALVEQAATNLYLQFGVLGVTVLVLFLFARKVVDRMFEREDKNEADKITVLVNNTSAMNACAQRLERIEAAVNNFPCQYSGPRAAQNPGDRPPPGPRPWSGSQPVYLSQGQGG